MNKPSGYAALFVDFENAYYHLDQNLAEGMDPLDVVSRLLRTVKTWIQSERSARCIIAHAYADFERIEENAQSTLYLLGVESHNVLGTDHKNAADMGLCIDAMEVLYTRPEIDTFVFLAGDRDYIPLIQHLRVHARDVVVVAFQNSMSGDLLQIIEDSNFVAAEKLLPSDVKFDYGRKMAARQAAQEQAARTASKTAVPPVAPPSKFAPVRRLSAENELDALQVMLDYFGDKRDVWVTPYLRRLREQLPLLAEYERKALITYLADAGVVVVEKRPGDGNEFSVLVINWNHPDVRERYDGERPVTRSMSFTVE